MNFLTAQKKLDFHQLEDTYNDLKAERTQAQCRVRGGIEAGQRCQHRPERLLTDHMVDLTPEQIEGLQQKDRRNWILRSCRSTLPEANIVDRCESCHMGAREPVQDQRSRHAGKGGKKPDEYSRPLPAIPSLNY